MCANYRPPRQLELEFGGRPAPFEYLNDLYPGHFGPILLQDPKHDDEFEIARAMFGMVPHWAKDATLSRQTYNCRSETVTERPSFKAAWKQHRFCLIPVDQFYEPYYEGEKKPVRWRIFRKDGKPFCFAGIWEICDSKEPEVEPGKLRSMSMLTVNADGHPIMERFHAPGHEKRSPVVINPEDYHAWLNAKSDAEARSFLKLFDPDEFDCEPAPRPPRDPSTAPAKKAAPRKSSSRKKPPAPAADNTGGLLDE